MKIEKYLRSILPSFDRKMLAEDIAAAQGSLDEVTIPAYKAAAAVFTDSRFKAQLVKNMEKDISKKFSREKGNHIAIIHVLLTKTEQTLKEIADGLERRYGKEIIREGITYKMVNEMQLVEAANFVSQYARRYLLAVYAMEVSEEGLSGPGAPAEYRWLTEKYDNFIAALSIMSRGPVAIKRSLDKIPEITADPDNDAAIRAGVGAAKVDPFTMGLIPVSLNPIYHVRMAIATWQDKRHQLLMEEQSQLQFRLLHLKQERQGGAKDAKLEQTIEYNQDRINKLRAKIIKLEGGDHGE